MNAADVAVPAWCGRCGQSFRLAELAAEGAAGRCPRCGRPFAPSYTAVLDTAVHDLLAAVAAVRSAGRRINETAPHLHVDLQIDLRAEPGDARRR